MFELNIVVMLESSLGMHCLEAQPLEDSSFVDNPFYKKLEEKIFT
jgi:hypothetical protein